MAGSDIVSGKTFKQVGEIVAPILTPLAVGVATQPLLLPVTLGAAVFGAGVWVGYAITSAARA